IVSNQKRRPGFPTAIPPASPLSSGNSNKWPIFSLLQKNISFLEKNVKKEKASLGTRSPASFRGRERLREPSGQVDSLSAVSALAALRRFRTAPATPASPVPSSTIVAGSGTGVSAVEPVQKKKLSSPPGASVTLPDRP